MKWMEIWRISAYKHKNRMRKHTSKHAATIEERDWLVPTLCWVWRPSWGHGWQSARACRRGHCSTRCSAERTRCHSFSGGLKWKFPWNDGVKRHSDHRQAYDSDFNRCFSILECARFTSSVAEQCGIVKSLQAQGDCSLIAFHSDSQNGQHGVPAAHQ